MHFQSKNYINYFDNNQPIIYNQNAPMVNKYNLNNELYCSNHYDVPEEVDDYIEEYFKREQIKDIIISPELSQDVGSSHPVIQNIACFFDLNCGLDLSHIAKSALNTKYDAKCFPAVIMRIRKPKTTANIFKNGKIICAGAKTEEDAKKATRKISRIIQKLGYKIRYNNFKILNMVASCDVRFQIGLDPLNLLHSSFTTYDPEQFPGLFYKMADPLITILIFKSGKIILTGGKDKSNIDEAYNKILPVLKMFKKEIPNQNIIKQ